MNNIQVLGKFLDQSILTAKFQKKVPAVLLGASAAYTAVKSVSAPKGKKKQTLIETGMTSGIAAISALAAPHIASKYAKRPLASALDRVKESTGNLIDNFIKSNPVSDKTKEILNKGRNKILNMKEIKTLFETLSKNKNGKDFLEKLIPSPKNISAKDIFSEIGYLSIFGAVPVLGGIIGGIAADKTAGRKNWKERVPDKIKEGSYQYLANIFMCNIGAGAALAALEKAGITSKGARALGMTAGIIAAGVIGGSKIADIIGRKVIDPVCSAFENKKDAFKYMRKEVNQPAERTPEMLDLGLHADDIATVSLLSGLKWIEPALPILYTISGYRAGIGYRNNKDVQHGMNGSRK